MLVAFFESIKYVGHLVPIAIFRWSIAYFYLEQVTARVESGFLNRPTLAALISEWLPKSQAPEFYKEFLELVVIPQWQTAAYFIVTLEYIIVISFFIGFLVRPVAILATLLSWVFVLFIGPPYRETHHLLMLVNFTLAWIGAGRCLGFDYYFFKKRRGLWW